MNQIAAINLKDMRLEYPVQTPAVRKLDYLPSAYTGITLAGHKREVQNGPLGTLVNQWRATPEYEICATIFSCMAPGILRSKVKKSNTTFYLAACKEQVILRRHIFSTREMVVTEGDLISIPCKWPNRRFRVRFDTEGLYISIQLAVTDPFSTLLLEEQHVLDLFADYRNFIDNCR
jgi:hypothetical protein